MRLEMNTKRCRQTVQYEDVGHWCFIAGCAKLKAYKLRDVPLITASRICGRRRKADGEWFEPRTTTVTGRSHRINSVAASVHPVEEA